MCLNVHKTRLNIKKWYNAYYRINIYIQSSRISVYKNYIDLIFSVCQFYIIKDLWFVNISYDKVSRANQQTENIFLVDKRWTHAASVGVIIM